MAKWIGKILGMAVGGAVGLLVLGYLLLLAINLNDLPPTQTALQLESASRSPVTAEDGDNGYLFLLGFSADPNQDPAVLGAQRLAWAKSAVARPGVLDEAEQPGGNSARERSAMAKRFAEGCKEGGRNCLSLLEGKELNLADWLAADGWLLTRYKRLLDHPAWFEPLPPDPRLPLPRFVDAADGQRLLMAEAWQLAGQGDALGVRALLERDIRFWRMVLERSGTLISKAVASSVLERHFGLANLALRRLSPRQAMEGVPDAWKVAVSPRERSMRQVVAGELVFAERLLRGVKTQEQSEDPLHFMVGLEEGNWLAGLYYRTWPLLSPLLQVQATVNRQAEIFASVADAFDSEYANLRAATEQARAIEQENAVPQWRWFNPMADYLLFAGMPAVTDYGMRIADLEGLRRGVLLASQLRSREVPPGDAPRQLAESELRNPYDGAPLDWDGEAGAVAFKGLDTGPLGRKLILY